jgi:hypothetical protein
VVRAEGLAKLPVDAVIDGESWHSTPTGGDHSTRYLDPLEVPLSVPFSPKAQAVPPWDSDTRVPTIC